MSRLEVVKLAHTVVWAVFASCILAIPVLAAQNHFVAATALAASSWWRSSCSG